MVLKQIVPFSTGMISLGLSPSPELPNPFNPTTVVSYQVPVASEVRLAVYDVLGREYQCSYMK